MPRLRFVAAAVLCAAFTCMASPSHADDEKAGTVSAIDTVKRQVTISVDTAGTVYTVTGDSAADKVGTLAPGDRVNFKPGTDQKVDAATIQKANTIVPVPLRDKLLAFVLAGLVVLLLASWAAGWNIGRYFTGKDKRLSNSQTQLVLWSATVVIVYLTTVLLRAYYGAASATMIGGVEIPQNLLLLSGLSGISFAGARSITTSKDASAKAQNATNAAAIAAGTAVAEPEKQADGDGPAFTDLFQDDHDILDLGDTQMIFITVIAVVLYWAKSLAFLSNIEIAPHALLPDVDTYLLTSFGIGQGAYLAKKAASKAGNG